MNKRTSTRRALSLDLRACYITPYPLLSPDELLLGLRAAAAGEACNLLRLAETLSAAANAQLMLENDPAFPGLKGASSFLPGEG